jgi:hypothetical protein
MFVFQWIHHPSSDYGQTIANSNFLCYGLLSSRYHSSGLLADLGHLIHTILLRYHQTAVNTSNYKDFFFPLRWYGHNHTEPRDGKRESDRKFDMDPAKTRLTTVESF